MHKWVTLKACCPISNHSTKKKFKPSYLLYLQIFWWPFVRNETRSYHKKHSWLVSYWEMRCLFQGGIYFFLRGTTDCAFFFFSKMPLEETISELRKELEQCLVSNKTKREQVHQLETDLSALKDQLKDQEIKAQRMEKIAQEHEVEFFVLLFFWIFSTIFATLQFCRHLTNKE